MTEHNFEHMRRAMVASQLRTTGVNDPRVVAAMGAVPRERFVPDDRITVAYADALVPLGNGRQPNTPMSLGRLLTEARPREDDQALVIEIGRASCRERVGQYVYNPGVAESLQKKIKRTT